MKYAWLILFQISSLLAAEDKFQLEAREVVMSLKTGLVKELTAQVKKGGAAEAVNFCQLNVKSIAKASVGEKAQKFEFGRTSHKLRNQSNLPEPWMEQYLQDFQSGKITGEVIHTLPDGKRVLLSPLTMAPLCLQCHGSAIDEKVLTQIKKSYPRDQATGFQAGDFRGFIWVKEKK